MDREELWNIRKYTFRAELDKALHTLEGILKGISIDGKINKREVNDLTSWVNENYQFINRHPYNELIPLVNDAISDSILTKEEIADILWMSNNLHTENKYYDVITSDIQRLEGILHGILADNIISDDEINALGQWLFSNDQMTGAYPFDELCSLITAIKADGKIDENERKLLKLFISDFVDIKKMESIDQAEIENLKKTITIQGICALDPQMVFQNKYYCLTGIFSRKQNEIESLIESKGGVNCQNVTLKTDYLIVGASGNPCWAFSCYGRKVEKAIQMRKDGKMIAIVNEVDLLDAF